MLSCPTISTTAEKTMPNNNPALNTFTQYQSIRHRLPSAPKATHQPKTRHNILELSDTYDTFLFDAFGVLNVADKAIPNAAQHIAKLRQQGKNLLVVSNAATYHKPKMVEKFSRLGFDFSANEIITSRDALLEGVQTYPRDMRWGIISAKDGQNDLDALGLNYHFYDHPNFLHSDGFLFLSSHSWDDAQQQRFLNALNRTPRPILLGNPDLTAPMGSHTSIESGSYVLLLDEPLFNHCQIFGKPFASIYHLAEKRLQQQGKTLHKPHTLMCGDTLHTDILGAAAYGIHSALITDHGFFKNLNANKFITQSNLIPNYLIPAL